MLLSDILAVEAWGREFVEVNFQGEPKATPWTHGTPFKAAADGWCHMDICKGYVVAWPTNLGWMTGPWLVYASLLNGASMALYNGSPLGSGFAKFVQMWIAQGFIRPFDENQELEVAQGECCTVSSYVRNIPEKVHHVSFSSNFTVLLIQDLPNFILQLDNVRTVLFPIEGVRRTSESFLVEICISEFKSLRVLDLRFSHIYRLPISIGNLKHLRYLNISSNSNIRELPSSICKLLNLQTFLLASFWQLQKLPTGIGKLINLRHLLLSTNQMFFPKEGIGHLKSLQFLGNLEFLPSGTKHLTALETLSIENCEKIVLTEWEEDNEDLRLSVQTVLITRLPQLETLPQWLRGAKDTLQLISIQDCWDLKALPEWLQYLTSLLKLEISVCPRLCALLEEMCYLTALRELKIEDCPELNRRYEERTGKDWPKIAHVPKIVRLERTSEMFRNRKRMLNKLLFLNQ